MNAPLRREMLSVPALAAIILASAALITPAKAVVVYSNVSTPPPATAPSQPYQAGHASEFGDLIQFAGTNRNLTSVTILMDAGAHAVDWPGVGTAAGWLWPITLNLYLVDNSGPNPAPGTKFATLTQTFLIPWAPTTPPYDRTGLPFEVTFNFTGITLPNQIIFGVAINTQTFGYAPVGAPGPYDSLNFAVATVPPTVGTNPFPDTAYLYADGGCSYYNDCGPGGTFRRDTGWLPYSAAAIFNADPAAATSSAFQISYAANLNIGDSVVNLSNDGSNGGVFGAGTTGNICVNAYVFDPQEEEISCCSCLVTPDGLNSLSVKADLISNNLTPAVPTSVTIDLLASQPGINTAGAFTLCNPATGVVGSVVGAGLLAWGTTLEPNSTPGTYNTVPVRYLTGTLNTSELTGLTSLCNFIQANGTGFGICKSCRLGALGGAKQ